MAIDKEKPDDLGSSGLNSWRRRRDSDFFSEANKIKDLALCILVKIAQGHQKGHQKIQENSSIED